DVFQCCLDLSQLLGGLASGRIIPPGKEVGYLVRPDIQPGYERVTHDTRLRSARLKPHKAPRETMTLTPRQTSPAVVSCCQRSSQHASKSNPSRPTKRAHSHGRLRRAGLSRRVTSALVASATVRKLPE